MEPLSLSIYMIVIVGFIVILWAYKSTSKNIEKVKMPNETEIGEEYYKPTERYSLLPSRKVQVFLVSPLGIKKLSRWHGLKINKFGQITIKGQPVIYSIKHIQYVDGKPSLFIDANTYSSIPPPNVEETISDNIIELASRMRAIMLSHLMLERRERMFILIALITIIASLIIVGFTQWQMSNTIQKMADAFNNALGTIKNMTQLPPPK